MALLFTTVSGAPSLAARSYSFSFFRLTQGSHASWKVLDFFLENSLTWKVLENHFGPESPGKISLKVMHFSSGSNGKQAAIL